jgi:hypothetical protein
MQPPTAMPAMAPTDNDEELEGVGLGSGPTQNWAIACHKYGAQGSSTVKIKKAKRRREMSEKKR